MLRPRMAHGSQSEVSASYPFPNGRDASLGEAITPGDMKD